MTLSDGNVRSVDGSKATVVLFGARSEIGTAIVEVLASDGFRVVTTHRKPIPEERTDEQGRPLGYAVDVRDHRRVTRFFEDIEARFGPPYSLVYVAGCLREAPIALLTSEAWSEVLETNLGGAFACLRSTARPMMVAGRGRIILVGSVSASVGIPGQAAYAASKAGLEALARVAAVEFGRYGITCNVVAPGAIDAGMFRQVGERAVMKMVQRTALRRLGTAGEVAAAVRFLLGPDAGYITGQMIVVDGGLLAS